MSLSVEIVTPAAVAWKGEATEVQAPGMAGEFGAMSDHAAMLAVTRAGVVTVHTATGAKRMVVGTGFAEVGPGQVTLLVDLCEPSADVDKDAAQASLAAAEETLATADPSTGEWAKARKAADLAAARLEA
jgi:F-type H+-transporting ATPase subunit epsilon